MGILGGMFPPITSPLLPANSSHSEKPLPKKCFHVTPVRTSAVVASGPQRGGPAFLRAGNSSGITTLDLHAAAAAV